eukprot:snap_masked-scaffold_1-processed-gene-22.48-mRNA-1 protein AED:0.06 eAED:0.06 QI:0/-1/0/1/-1/1/1/0/423
MKSSTKIALAVGTLALLVARHELLKKSNKSFPEEESKETGKLYGFKGPDKVHLLYANLLQGITFQNLVRLVGRYWRYINFKKYGLRLLALFGMSIMNSAFDIVENKIVYKQQIENQEINKEPLFVLGHPRSGTTLLHNLFSMHKERFIYPSTFQCGFSSGFILLAPFTFLFKNSIGKTRPMDNMPLSFETPQEDELATNVLSTYSPYLPLTFMSCEPLFRPFFSFREAPKERKVWEDCFKLFLKKVTLVNKKKFGATKLVIKSPVHTARGELLTQMFPKGQFIYIYRNPYTVFKSAANMAEKTYFNSFLTSASDFQIQEFILNQYEVLFDEYVKAKNEGFLVPGKNLIEIKYEDMTKDLVGTMKNVYETFSLPGWDEVKGTYMAEEEKSKSFKRNKFVDLDPELKEVVYTRLKRAFDYFGYKK